MPDNHLTGWPGAEGDKVPAGLGAGGCTAGADPGIPPPPYLAGVRRKKGRPLSASPLVGPTHIPDASHNNPDNTPYRKRGYTLFVF